jgi:hypothetical protein
MYVYICVYIDMFINTYICICIRMYVFVFTIFSNYGTKTIIGHVKEDSEDKKDTDVSQ